MYSTIKNLFNSKLSVLGNFEQPKLLTGTWAHIYVFRNNKKRMVEITEPALRDKLMMLENIVVNKLK
jgi:hypothetical protein